MTIFVSVASYRDPDLEGTIRSAWENAWSPERLYFGIVFQGGGREIPNLDFLPESNYTMISMHPREAQGVGYARSLAMNIFDGMFNDTDYYLQIDSHMQFVKHWDLTCMQEFIAAEHQTKNPPILSAFPPPYIHGGRTKMIEFPKNMGDGRVAYPTKQRAILRGSGDWGAERVEFEDQGFSLPELSNTVLGAFIFTYASIIQDVPYDPEISFFGEELCFAARAWTNGYDIYSPSKVIAYHHYVRNGNHKIWNAQSLLKRSWKDIQAASYEKQKRVLCGIEKGIYGVGSIRSLEDYEAFVGINFKQHYGVE